MNRNVVGIVAIIVLVLVVAFGARYFFGANEATPETTATTGSSTTGATQNAEPTDGASEQPN